MQATTLDKCSRRCCQVQRPRHTAGKRQGGAETCSEKAPRDAAHKQMPEDNSQPNGPLPSAAERRYIMRRNGQDTLTLARAQTA